MTDAATTEADLPKPLVHGVAERAQPARAPHRRADNPGRMTGPGTNTYLVGIDEIVVIDPGPDDAGPPRRDRRLRRRPHPVDRSARTPTTTTPRASPASRSATGAEVLAFDERATAWRSTGRIGDGDVIEATEFVLRAMHTPGHASNHLCFLLEQERMLFSGDHIMEGVDRRDRATRRRHGRLPRRRSSASSALRPGCARSPPATATSSTNRSPRSTSTSTTARPGAPDPAGAERGRATTGSTTRSRRALRRRDLPPELLADGGVARCWAHLRKLSETARPRATPPTVGLVRGVAPAAVRCADGS